MDEFDDKRLRGRAARDELLVGSADIQSLADLGNSFEEVKVWATARGDMGERSPASAPKRRRPLTGSGSADATDRFSLVAGGPFSAVLGRLGLIGADQLPTRRAAIGLALLAWLPPALLAAAQSLVDDRYSGWGFFADSTVYTRYLVAIWVMLATERYADGRIALLSRQFRDARLVSDDGLPAFQAALADADRRSSSALAEAVILGAALIWSSLTARYAVALAGSSWEGAVIAGEVVLSWAGETARFVSNPLFLFLVLRWIWRFLVWTALLHRISRLPLQLTPLHPDRSAGLGFLAIYPSIFTGFIFALSCVVASNFLKELGLETHSSETVWFAIAGWLAFSLVLLLGPLLVFVGPLYAVRERALLEYGRLVAQHHLAFHRKWIEEPRSGADLMGSADPSSASDLNASVQAVREMRVFPIDGAAVVQLVAAAGVPLLAVVATQIPLVDLAKWIVGTIL